MNNSINIMKSWLKNKLEISNIKSDVVLREFIFWISMIIIIWSFFTTISGISYVMNADIHDRLYQYDDIVKALSEIFKIHSSILMAPIVLSCFMLFKKHMKIEYVAISLLLSFFVPIYQYSDQYLHPLLFSTHIYDFLMVKGQTVLNPQYTKILIYLILISILFVFALLKKTRSADRIFVLLIASAILVTTIVFHFALPMGMFKYTKYQLQQDIVNQMNTLPQDMYCEKRSCFILDKNLNMLKKTNDSNEELLSRYAYFTHGIKTYYEQTHSTQVFTTALGAFQGQMFDYVISAAKPVKEGYLIVMDENINKPYSRQSELWFSFLAAVAHGFWFFGGVGLLFLHKKRFFRKLSPRLKSEA